MKYLTSFLEQIEKSEHLGSVTDKTDKSTCSVTDGAPASVPESPPSMRCDDCGQECTVTLVTSYGGRFCRRCVFPAETRTQKGRRFHA